MDEAEVREKLRELEDVKELVRLMEEEKRLKEELPHRYRLKHYDWSRRFFESREKKNVLVAANQLGKSTTQIRKTIEWAVNTELWPELWPETYKKGMTPNLFWYMYPTKSLASEEFLTKWKPLLPQGKMKDHPIFGWKEVWEGGDIYGIEFNSGMLLVFKTYAQRAQDLQTGSVFALFIDEEPPVEILSELLMRTSGVDGYIHCVFTATLNQDFFRRVIEPRPDENEEWADALKLQVSLYDSMYFEDGTESEWTEKRIKAAESRCTTANEVLRRIFGKFISEGGARIHTFDPIKHVIKPHPIPRTWLIYSAVDFGTGVNKSGKRNHPSAILFLAVSPDYKMGRVFRGRRYDMIPMTTVKLVSEYIELRGDLQCTSQVYDWSSVEFDMHAVSMGLSFNRADKSFEKGIDLVRSLFQADALKIFESGDLVKLISEVQTLPVKVDKTKDHDDFFDTLRYACMAVPWDLTDYNNEVPLDEKEKLTEPTPDSELTERDLRRQFVEGGTNVEYKDEFDEWNELY